MMKNIIRYGILIILLGGLIYTFYYLYQKNEEPDEVFETTTAEMRDIVKQTVATGSVVPRQEIQIKPQVSGIIAKIYVEEGDRVKIGDLIAKVKVIPDMVSLNNAENRLSRAKLDFDNAKIDYDRNKKLLDQGVIAKADFQQIELSYRNSKQEFEAAKENLSIVKEGISSKSGELSNTNIRSTKSGTVLEVPVEEGNSVIESNNFNEGTTIAVIADLSDMIFKGKVDESEVGKIRSGMDIQLRIGAIENEVYKAKLEFISPKGIEENGAIQFEIRAALELKEGKFVRSGYSANAEIVLDRKDSVLAIKESLVTYKGDTVVVEVEDKPQQYHEQIITLGLSDGIYAEVLSGVDSTMQIKVPQSKLKAE